MPTFSFDLYFQTHKVKGKLPSHPVAQIYVKNSVGDTYPDAKGFSFISLQCLTQQELTHEISRLERELKEIRAKAKKKFAKTA